MTKRSSIIVATSVLIQPTSGINLCGPKKQTPTNHDHIPNSINIRPQGIDHSVDMSELTDSTDHDAMSESTNPFDETEAEEDANTENPVQKVITKFAEMVTDLLNCGGGGN